MGDKKKKKKKVSNAPVEDKLPKKTKDVAAAGNPERATEIKAQMEALKPEKKELWEKARKFGFAHKIKLNEKPKDKKLLKEYTEVVEPWLAMKKKWEALETELGKVKPRSTGVRSTKYEYPADVNTPDAKKKYRAEMRKKNSGDEGGTGKKKKKAAKEEVAKPSKKKDKGEAAAPAAEVKKKKKKKKVQAAD